MTVFITGTDKGLGRALLNTFLVHGYHVFAGRFDSNTSYSESRAMGGDSMAIIPLDVTSPDSVHQAKEIVVSQTDALDIIINNAGIIHMHHDQPLEQINIEEIPAIMDVNAYGPLRVTQAFLPLLRNGSGKLLVNISSEAARLEECKYSDRIGYCMSKASVNIQSKVLQNYLAPEGIKVLAVHPGWMQTDMGGPEADVPPIESARGVYELSRQTWEIDGPIFVNYVGKPMKW